MKANCNSGLKLINHLISFTYMIVLKEIQLITIVIKSDHIKNLINYHIQSFYYQLFKIKVNDN